MSESIARRTSSRIEIPKKLKALRRATQSLRAAPRSQKDAVLSRIAELLLLERKKILQANARDLAALSKQAAPAFRDRLLLDEHRLRQMSESARQVQALPDPVGEVVEERALSNGLRVQRVRSPLGVVFLIFESRPNVAVESFTLALKAGNGMILRGGSESMGTTAVLYRLLQQALRESGLSQNLLWGIADPDRSIPKRLLAEKDFIDVVVPRGGAGLIEFVTRNSQIPVIKNDRGMCHVYVHEDADLEMARAIVINAKTQRPGVCNAMETLLVHQAVAAELLPSLHAELEAWHVRWKACPETRKALGKKRNVAPARAGDWDTEHLDLILNCRVVKTLEEALAHIEAHGSRHSEAIVTRSTEVARSFQARIDAAAVYWNASTRFTDGFELGLGGELGISTQKLHVRGPVGLRELTSVRWVMDGEGQVRK